MPMAIPRVSGAFGLPVVADTIAGFVGPLAGVLAGMRWSRPKRRSALGGDRRRRRAAAAARSGRRLLAAVDGRAGRIALAQSTANCTPSSACGRSRWRRTWRSSSARACARSSHWTDRHGSVAVTFRPRALRPRASIRSSMPTRRRSWTSCAPCWRRSRAMTGGTARPVIGIAGWKKSGKTTLVARLIAEFTRRGLKVATVKHAHHDFQIDAAETDSARHRRAGASRWRSSRPAAGPWSRSCAVPPSRASRRFSPGSGPATSSSSKATSRRPSPRSRRGAAQPSATAACRQGPQRHRDRRRPCRRGRWPAGVRARRHSGHRRLPGAGGGDWPDGGTTCCRLARGAQAPLCSTEGRRPSQLLSPSAALSASDGASGRRRPSRLCQHPHVATHHFATFPPSSARPAREPRPQLAGARQTGGTRGHKRLCPVCYGHAGRSPT